MFSRHAPPASPSAPAFAARFRWFVETVAPSSSSSLPPPTASLTAQDFDWALDAAAFGADAPAAPAAPIGGGGDRLAVGTRVSAVSAWDDLWYDGRVVAVHSRGRYSIAFDGYEAQPETVGRECIEVIQTEAEKLAAMKRRIQLRVDMVRGASADGTTALHVAARAGDLELARWLLARGARPNAQDSGGFTPLHRACGKAHIPIVELLLDHGASPRLRARLSKECAYDVAKWHNHRTVCFMLEQRTKRQRHLEIHAHALRVRQEKRRRGGAR